MAKLPLPLPKLLYHGTLCMHREAIERDGLRPMTGPFVRDCYPRTKTKVLCACEPDLLRKAWKAMRFQTGALLGKPRHLVTMAEVEAHGMLVMLPVDGFELSTSDRARHRPTQVEKWDWWRWTPATPTGYLAGRAMVDEFHRLGSGVHPAQHLADDIAVLLVDASSVSGHDVRDDAMGEIRRRCDVIPGSDLGHSIPQLRRMERALRTNPKGRTARSLVAGYETHVRRTNASYEEWDRKREASAVSAITNVTDDDMLQPRT